MLDPPKPQQLKVLQCVIRTKNQIQSQDAGLKGHRHQY